METLLSPKRQKLQNGYATYCGDRLVGVLMTRQRKDALECLGYEVAPPTGGLVLSEHERKFSARLKDLIEHKAKFGDCNVPYRWEGNPSLGLWVNKQRIQYRLRQEGKPSYMTEEHVQRLNELEFEWREWRVRDIVVWKVRLDELSDYKEKYGDTNVPRHWQKNPRLGKWVAKQRESYRCLVQGKSSSMSPYRISALTELGFVWKFRDPVDWDVRLEELKEYRATHGDCNIPWSHPNKQLCRWVSDQRRRYRQLREGKSTTMTPDRLNRLEQLGFVWSLPEKLKLDKILAAQSAPKMEV